MKENIFVLNSYSKYRFILLLFLIVIISSVFLVAISTLSLSNLYLLYIIIAIGFLITIAIQFLFFFRLYKLAKTEVQLELLDDRIELSKRFKKNEEPKVILLNEIASYKISTSRNFTSLIIYHINKKSFKLHFYYDDETDDTSSLIKVFPDYIMAYNKKTIDNKIRVKQSVFEKKWFAYLFFFLLFMIVTMFIFMYLKFGISEFNYSGIVQMLIIIAPLIFLASYFIKKIRK